MSVRSWIGSRWSGPDRMSALLNKPIPRNVSWWHTLGSLLLLYLGFQALTGVLLGLYYSPSSHDAYDSVQFIDNELFLGRFIHHLHRFGAGFILLTAFLHMVRSYLLGAYKAPRELMWISGVVLLMILTAFAFTGQLLPYDQRGYWATVVGIQIAASPPVVGKMVRDLLTGGYGDIGTVTLARFYIMHVCVLPLITAGLIAVHLSMLRKVGSAGPTSGSGEPYRSFHPYQTYKDALVALAGTAALCLIAATWTPAETGPADPTNSSFVPRPEWYFLAHYQLLKYLPAGWQIGGTVVLPTIVLALLLLLPFLDRNPKRAFRRRWVALVAGGLGCAAVVVLTGLGLAGTPPIEGAESRQDPVAHGKTLFDEKKCIQCHTIGGEGGEKGPDLSHVGRRLRRDYLADWIRSPQRFKPATEMPAFEGSAEELQAIVDYLMSLD